jgi:hypothetical protein
MAWSSGELRHIVEADDLKIAPFRDDGVTPIKRSKRCV